MKTQRVCEIEDCGLTAVGHYVAVTDDGVPAFDKAAGYYCASHAKGIQQVLAGHGCDLQRVRLLEVPEDAVLEPQKGHQLKSESCVGSLSKGHGHRENEKR